MGVGGDLRPYKADKHGGATQGPRSNVILAVAGYFSIVAPNGMRVGDRVSLQGPFGYVHGEVIEIGLVRTRLRELAGEPLQPTGRIVVYPNSVMFTGSFFKHPAPEVGGR